MDFFKSVFSKDEQPPESSATDNPNPNSFWSSGGGLIRALATKSESVVETYRKDFDEFRSGLKKETSMIREVASRAVKDLPTSFEIGASVAQESLESVGQAIDDIGSTVWKSTADIIAQGRRNLLPPDHTYSDSDDNSNNNNNSRRLSNIKPYSRFEIQLHAIQCDHDTYCREPEDLAEYENWKLGFVLDDEKNSEIKTLVQENEVVGEIYRDVVSNSEVVDEETFWSRYFYRVHKLKQAEEARARLVKRAISMEEDEELTWDFDDEDEGSNAMSKNDAEDSKNRNSGGEEKANEKVVVAEGSAENGESCKDSDLSIVSSQPSMPEEEELGWDEIEDIGGNDENKGDAVGSLSRADVRKRLSAAEEDEDLSWDIEDDEAPSKS